MGCGRLGAGLADALSDAEQGIFQADAAAAQAGLNLLISEPVELMLLGWGRPDFDGMDVIRKVRKWSQVPILVVSAIGIEKRRSRWTQAQTIT